MKSFVLLLLCLSLGHCEPVLTWLSYSTSVMAMTNLLEAEHWLAETIYDDFLSSEPESNVPVVRSFIDNILEEHKKSEDNLEAYLSNPLNSFALVRRMHEDWRSILNGLENPLKEYLEETLVAAGTPLPTSKDMTEAAVGMERIRRTYNLSPADMAIGLLGGVKNDAKLSSLDLYAIGLELFKLEQYMEAASWLKVAVSIDSQGDRETIEMLYLESVQRQSLLPAEMEFDALDSDEDFERSCRGENLRSVNNLLCRYNTSVNGFFTLAPPKMEELSMEPFVVIFHDVLTSAEINYIKNEAYSKLSRAKVFSEGQNNLYDDIRTTHSATIALRDATMRKIVAISQMDPEGFENTSVLNYGLGGHYSSHEDYFYPEKDDSVEEHGDRIATMLLYLNDVNQGGSTIFPRIGVDVKPKRGSLLLWYNLKNSGQADPYTIHGACPVIFGSKWAVTIWVREKAQFRTMPCFNP